MLPSIALTLAVGAVGIGDRSLWSDEYATWYASTLRIPDLFRLLDHIDAVLAPYYFFMRGWIGAFGDSELTLRLPSLIAMAVAAGLVTLIGRRLFDSAVGVGAGLLFAVLPTVSRYGQEARPYALVIAAVALATLLLLRALDNPSWVRWGAYGACLAGVGLTHFVALTVVMAHALVVWRAMRIRSDFRLLRWLAALAGTVTVVLPLAAKGSTESGAIDWIKADSRAVQQLPQAMFGTPAVAGIVIVFALVTVVVLWFSSDRGALALLAPWALLPPVFCYLTFPILHLFLHRYLLFTLPAWALLCTAAVFSAARLRWRTPPSWLSLGSALLLVSAVLYVGLPGQSAVRRSPVNGEPDFRAAAAAVASRMRPGDGIAYAGTFRSGRRSFAYELRTMTPPRDVFLARSSQELGIYGVAECKEPGVCLGDTQRIWLVTTSPVDDPYRGMPIPIAALLDAEFARSQVKRFDQAHVMLLTRTAR